MSWRRFGVLVAQLPLHSATVQAVADYPGWGLPESLLAQVVERLDAANWQRANTGRPVREHSTYPEPVRPWVKPVDDNAHRRFGTTSHTVDQMRHILDTWGEGTN